MLVTTHNKFLVPRLLLQFRGHEITASSDGGGKRCCRKRLVTDGRMMNHCLLSTLSQVFENHRVYVWLRLLMLLRLKHVVEDADQSVVDGQQNDQHLPTSAPVLHDAA